MRSYGIGKNIGGFPPYFPISHAGKNQVTVSVKDRPLGFENSLMAIPHISD